MKAQNQQKQAISSCNKLSNKLSSKMISQRQADHTLS